MPRLLGFALLFTAVAGCKRPPPLRTEGTAIYTPGKPPEPRSLVAFEGGTCATRKNGIWCWGDLGIDVPRHPVPTRMPFEDVTSIALGGSHYCVLKKDRTVACAGRNLDGELGDGSLTNRSEQRAVPGLANVVHLAAGSYKTCAIVEAAPSKHEVYCFGADEGRGSHGIPAHVATPTRVGDIEDARELLVEWGLACVRRADGSVWCWGSDQRGQLGRGGPRWGARPEPAADPVRVLHVTDAVGLSAASFGACVLTARGTVGCWGEGSYGALGDGTRSARGYPSDVVNLDDVAEVAAGSFGHALARRRDGTVWRWGYRIGDERAKDGDVTPVRVSAIDDAVEVAAGHTHACARRKDGSVWCWGNNESGQLGDGTSVPSRAPRRILEAE